MATTNQMSVNDALSVFDKTFMRSKVKLEEISEDMGGLLQMFPQLISHFDQRLLESQAITKKLQEESGLYQTYINDLIRVLHEHNIGIPEPPAGLPKKEATQTDQAPAQ